MELTIRPDGHIVCLYAESIDLTALGTLQIRRASYVEPDAEGHWWADLDPVSGPKLGPFMLRSHALQAEQFWLEVHLLNQSAQ